MFCSIPTNCLRFAHGPTSQTGLFLPLQTSDLKPTHSRGRGLPGDLWGSNLMQIHMVILMFFSVKKKLCLGWCHISWLPLLLYWTYHFSRNLGPFWGKKVVKVESTQKLMGWAPAGPPAPSHSAPHSHWRAKIHLAGLCVSPPERKTSTLPLEPSL